jgi:chloride channel 7
MSGDIGSKAGSTKVVPASRQNFWTDGSSPKPSERSDLEDGVPAVNVDKRLKTGGKADGRRGVFGGEDQAGVLALLQDKFRKVSTYGSRMVGGTEPTDTEKYNKYEAVSYITPDTVAVESTYLNLSPRKRTTQRILLWIRYALTGGVVSVVIALALRICKTIEKTRVKYTTSALDDGDIATGWMIWVGSSVAMNLVALFLVLLQPGAASSGIPGLIAFLNGVEPSGGKSPITKQKTSWVSLRTMSAKFLGMLCSIPSGLAIGPEGPIIHISALLGFWVTKLVHYLEGRIYGEGFDHETEDEKRDFLATGAACGITTAFRAPVAGTLFVVEEAGSFFTTQHLEFTFFSCLISYWVQWCIGQYLDGESAGDAKFQQTTGYFCNVDNPLNMVAYLMMSVLGGCLGALFNQIVEKLNHLRSHYINEYGLRRLLEILVLTLVTGSVVIFLPMNALCRKATRDVMLRDSAGCLPQEDFAQVSYGEVQFGYLNHIINSTAFQSIPGHHRNLAETDDTIPTLYSNPYGSGSNASYDLRNVLRNMRVVPEHRANIHDTVILDNAADQGPYIHVHYEHTYTCGKNSHSFNDMAMLWLNGGVKGVKVLMQRGFPGLISQSTLWWFLAAYFMLAALTAGTHVPAGLVVPLLLIGGAFGRLFGVYWMNFKKSLCENYVPLESAPAMMTMGTDPNDWLGYDMYYWGMTYRWIIRDCKLPDPGTFAVIGMASFMGGSGRISVMLAVVMLELTGDAGLIAPVGIVCILAMLVGNIFNHGLYHGLIPIMNLPYLNAQPAHVMYVTRVVSIMSKRLTYLPQMCRAAELKMLKKRCDSGKVTHHGFPVVRRSFDKHLVGLLSRKALYHVLRDLDSKYIFIT